MLPYEKLTNIQLYICRLSRVIDLLLVQIPTHRKHPPIKYACFSILQLSTFNYQVIVSFGSNVEYHSINNHDKCIESDLIGEV